MNRPTLLLAALLSALAPFPTEAQAEAPPSITVTTTVYGNDPCPKGKGDEIVVCAREPESERYRIPKRFRRGPRIESGDSLSWAARVEGLDSAQRFTMPNGCSPVGSNGQTGCTQAMIHQWYLERHMPPDLP